MQNKKYSVRAGVGSTNNQTLTFSAVYFDEKEAYDKYHELNLDYKYSYVAMDIENADPVN